MELRSTERIDLVTVVVRSAAGFAAGRACGLPRSTPEGER